MDETDLLHASRVIVGRNVSHTVAAAYIAWEPLEAKLTLVYFVREDTDIEEDEDLWDLALAELSCEFPEVRTLDGSVRREYPPDHLTGMQLVYSAPA